MNARNSLTHSQVCGESERSKRGNETVGSSNNAGREGVQFKGLGGAPNGPDPLGER